MKHDDITGKIGSLFPDASDPEIPMYSYSRPAYLFWQGFYEGLRERGMTDEQAFEEMQSKGVRWMLDLSGEMLGDLGRSMAQIYQPYCGK
jgi:hypothetical protein